MKSDKAWEYAPVPDSEKKLTDSDLPSSTAPPAYCEEIFHRPLRWRERIPPILPWVLLHILLIFGSISTGLLIAKSQSASNEHCSPNEHTSDVLIGIRKPSVKIRFDGSFNGPSPYKGPPSPEVDRAWDTILPLRVMAIPEPVFQSINASRHSVEVPKEVGTGGRMAVFDTIHLLHCLRALWKLAYPDYYLRNTSGWTEQTHQDWFDHINHCTDMIRQKLMCDASSALVPYNWISNHYHPHPNFNVEHTCRNYQELLEAEKRYAIGEDVLPEDGFFRKDGEVVHEFKEPPFDPEDEGTVVIVGRERRER